MLTQACFNMYFDIFKVEKNAKIHFAFKKKNLSISITLWKSCHAYWKNTRGSQTKERYV